MPIMEFGLCISSQNTHWRHIYREIIDEHKLCAHTLNPTISNCGVKTKRAKHSMVFSFALSPTFGAIGDRIIHVTCVIIRVCEVHLIVSY